MWRWRRPEVEAAVAAAGGSGGGISLSLLVNRGFEMSVLVVSSASISQHPHIDRRPSSSFTPDVRITVGQRLHLRPPPHRQPATTPPGSTCASPVHDSSDGQILQGSNPTETQKLANRLSSNDGESDGDAQQGRRSPPLTPVISASSPTQLTGSVVFHVCYRAIFLKGGFILWRYFSMKLVAVAPINVEDPNNRNDLWLVEPRKAKFPCCLVWTPLPIVSWLAPFIGHVGLCMEDGAVVDFSGSNFVNVDDFAYGSVARYIQLHPDQCCFPCNLASHTCKQRYKHAESGSAISWDDAVRSSRRHFEHKSYNLFTCNCHSFVANILNRMCYGGSMSWNMMNVAALVLFKGCWVNAMAVIRSFFPFTLMLCFGVSIVGWAFLIGLFSFCLVLFAWFFVATYFLNNLLEC